jgi:hypothetical protein
LTITGLAADSRLAGGTNLRWIRRIIAVFVMLAGAWFGAEFLPIGVGWVLASAAAIEAVAALLILHSGIVAEMMAKSATR